jgi:hypothetical protein
MDSRPQQAPPVTNSRRRGRRSVTSGKPRSLPIAEWPASVRLGWAQARRPGLRLKRGGAASHLAPVSQADIARRLGLYLDFLQRNGRLDPTSGVITLVTPDNVDGFITELQARVRSVTVWNSVYKLRRAAQLIAPGVDFGWLTEIEKDIALVMVPRSKADRLVLTERLVEAGLTLIREAEMFGKTSFARAVGVRNGLLIALLALHPIRIKNFAALTIADTFINIDGRMNVRYRNSSPTSSTAISKLTARSFAVAMPSSSRFGSRRPLGGASLPRTSVPSSRESRLKRSVSTSLPICSGQPAHRPPPSTVAIIRTSPVRFSLTATRASPRNTTIVRWVSAQAKSMPASLSSTVSRDQHSEISARPRRSASGHCEPSEPSGRWRT